MRRFSRPALWFAIHWCACSRRRCRGWKPEMDALLEAALAVRKNAHAPFSHFAVGAAVEDADGHIHTGCNVENATYGLTICAERVAVFKAISEGARPFTPVAVAAATGIMTPPFAPSRPLLCA